MVRIAIAGVLGTVLFATSALAQQAQERIINLDSLYTNPVIVAPKKPPPEGAGEMFSDQEFGTLQGNTAEMYPGEKYSAPAATWSRREESRTYMNPSGPAMGLDDRPLGSEDALGRRFWNVDPYN
jgi:hypothetical protein